MIWAKVALAGGLLLLCAGFAIGTEDQKTASVTDQSYSCGAAISASWLVPGTPDQTLNPGPGATADESRAAAACRPVIHQSRVTILTTMGVGGLLALVGWTFIREHRDSELPQVNPVHA